MSVAGQGRRGRWWAPTLILSGMSLLVLAVLNPPLILSPTTPTGGDMGAHVLGPAHLRDVLLPEGRIVGWSQAWFAGFPAFYFYFPLPSLVIVFLDLFIPYGVAFKVVTVLGLVATPPAVYFLARSLRLGRVVSVVAASSGVVFVLMESFSIYGANIASSLAGEFSFSWSFAFSLIYLGYLMRAVRDDSRYLTRASVFLALTALCHIITTIVIVFASIPILFWKNGHRVLVTWAWGFAISAVWALPLLARIGYTSDMAWTPLAAMAEILPAEVWLLLPLAVAGAVILARRSPRVIPVATFTLLPVVYFPLPRFLHSTFPDFFTQSRWKLWNGRLLPYWYFGVAFLGAVAVGFVARWLIRQLPARVATWWARGLIATAGGLAVWMLARAPGVPSWLAFVAGLATLFSIASTWLFWPTVDTRTLVVSAAAGLVALGALAGVSFVGGWAKWNYEGYEAKAAWEEYQGLMLTLASLPPGRVLWEPHSGSDGLNKYGTPMALMLIPYWTYGSHQSLEGLYFESSLTTPFHFILAGEMARRPSNPVPGLRYHNMCRGPEEAPECDPSRGVVHMDIYGIRYYVAYTPEAAAAADAHPNLTRVASSPPFVVFQTERWDLVVPASHQPAVYDAPEGSFADKVLGLVGAGSREPTFNDVALDWYDDLSLADRWITADGPEEWPRVADLAALRQAAPVGAREVTVSDVTLDDHRISFRTSGVGIPHLVKVSYFPNWEATGAEGPFHAAPSLMVVVPTSEEVVIEFRRQWPEVAGMVLTVLGTATALGAGLRRRRASGAAATTPAGSAAPA